MDGTVPRGYELEVEDTFDKEALDGSLWFPHHLPQWSSRASSAARYRLGGGRLRLLVEEDQPPWCPEFDGGVRVSSLQTGVFAGPLGSGVGQHRFAPGVVVREEQEDRRLYTPQYGYFEVRARMGDDPGAMAAFWMIGYEDRPERSAEICVVEVFGRTVRPDRAEIGMGVHPFGDPRITDEFAAETLPLDVREFHDYGVEWTPGSVALSVDGTPVKVVHQSPDYPMQFLLGLYAFPDEPGGTVPGPFPKEFVVDRFRGYRRAAGG